MGYSDLDPAVHERHPWNEGQNVGPKRPLKPRDIWAIRFYLDEHNRLRDRALFDLAIDSKLRGCDLVKIRIGDFLSGGSIRNRSTVIQQKTGRPVQFEIMSEARKSLSAWLERRRGTIHDFAFPSRIDYLGHLSTRQYARLVEEWVSTVGLDRREYGTHSLRRTKASLIYKATGNLRAVQILLGHTNIENTVRYLGVDIDDALTYQNAPKFDLSGSAIISGSRFAYMNDRQVTTNCQGVANGCYVGGNCHSRLAPLIVS